MLGIKSLLKDASIETAVETSLNSKINKTFFFWQYFSKITYFRFQWLTLNVHGRMSVRNSNHIFQKIKIYTRKSEY